MQCARRLTASVVVRAGSALARARTSTGLAAVTVVVALLSGCGSVSADEIASALESDGARAADAQCIADQAVTSDLSSDTLDRLAEEGITDDNGEDVQYLEDDSAILQALITACLQ